MVYYIMILSKLNYVMQYFYLIDFFTKTRFIANLKMYVINNYLL